MRLLVVLLFLNIVPLFLPLKWFLSEKGKGGFIKNWTQEESGAGKATELLGEGRRNSVNRNATLASLDPAPSSQGSANVIQKEYTLTKLVIHWPTLLSSGEKNLPGTR